MDTRTHHDSDASNQQDDASLLPADDPVMQQFLAHFDPLARLEAEYAAVLAQSSSSPTHKPSPEDDNDGNNQKHGDNSDENEDDGDGGEYARVPLSPTSDDETEAAGGEYYQPLGDASDSDDDDGAGDSDDDDESEAAPANGNGLGVPAAAPVVKMDAAKRETIMKSMQGMQLAPPPWAKSANLSDDELFAMVRDLNTK